MHSRFFSVLRARTGLGGKRTGHLEKWLSLTGGLAGILAIMLVSEASLGLSGSASLVASMGASAVLLFAVPHGALSQPWPVFGGHLVSAVVGVACAQTIAQPFLAAPLAVGLAIGAMHYLRCIHPPGGATALSAVMGGDAVQALGFQFVITPVLLNVLVILSIAVLFNFPFAWRRYPAALGGAHKAPGKADAQADGATDRPLRPADIRRGAYYSNGASGPRRQIRQVVTGSPENADADTVTYQVVAGIGHPRTGTVSREDFARWARYEVYLTESWQRAEATASDTA